MGKKSKHSYWYDLVKRGGNSAVMKSQKSIAARFYQLKTGHALMGKYLMHIEKRRDMKCWWCGHEYQTRDHLFKWCKRWKREQKQLWVDRQEGEEGVTRPAGGMSADHAIIQEGNNYLPVLLITI